MKVEFVNPFVVSATEVLLAETDSEVTRGKTDLACGSLVSDDVTVMVGVVGRAQGLVLYGMSEQTALNLVSAMAGEPFPQFDHLAESAVAELGNVITGLASADLERSGYPCTITPPSVVVGAGASIAIPSLPRLVIPLETRHGEVTVHVALRETY